MDSKLNNEVFQQALLKAKYKKAFKTLKEYARFHKVEHYEIAEDTYEYENGAIVIFYSDKEHEHEISHYCINVDDIVVDLSELYDLNSKEFKSGYAQALKDINTPLLMIMEDYSPSKCPRCQKDYFEYEPCDDGYYKRATSLERCPYCGQNIVWWE